MPSSHGPDGLSHSACRAKVRAHQSAEALIVGAPEELRAELRGPGTKQQVRRCARLRERPTRSRRGCWSCRGGADQRCSGPGELVACWSAALTGSLCCPGWVNPIPASSEQVTRHRLNRSGDPQLNCALHTIVVARPREDAQTRAYAARRRAEGKSVREIRRCLKRMVARQLFRLLERHDRAAVELANLS
jgi:transposase